MIDINAILTQAFNEALKPLVKRIEELEAKQAQPQPQLPPIDINTAMDELNQQEWFWEKIRSYIFLGIEMSLEDHTSTYNHDDFITKDDMPDPDDLVTKDELPEFPDTDDLVTTDTLKDYIDEALSDIRLVRR